MSIRLSTMQRSRNEVHYGLYCVNFFGTGLNSIKDEFKRQVCTGLRQTVYVIDLDDIPAEIAHDTLSRNSRQELKEHFDIHLMNSLITQIQECCTDYATKMKRIHEEIKFDVYKYWLQHDGYDKKMDIGKTDNKKSKVKAISKNGKKVQKAEKDHISCSSSLIAEKHNRISQPALLHTRKFRKDEPVVGKLYIIILGQTSGKRFYMELLRRNQPLEGVLNFTPTESTYDLMMGNKKLRNFIETTLENINFSNYAVRQEPTTKAVGLFTHNLPVLSSFLATKHSQLIFDQLTWSIYDVDVLRAQYEKYYFKPFQLINVEIPVSVNLKQLYHVAESLNIQGVHQKSSMCPIDADLTSIAVYLNSLLRTCSLQNDTVEDSLQMGFTNKFQNSLSAITTRSKHKCLVVAENNILLLNMLQHTDLEKFHSIYLCGLDYNIFVQYLLSPAEEIMPTSLEDKRKHHLYAPYCLTLPQYVKYFADRDCCSQRIRELISDYDKFEVQEFSPGCRLYRFKRYCNVLHRTEGRSIIPTRLCFRDFSLFTMDDFLKNLQTTALKTNSVPADHTTSLEVMENIFTRPNSLKAIYAQKETQVNVETKIKKYDAEAKKIKSEKQLSLSTPPNEENLDLPAISYTWKGYNLDDTLQEINYKTSEYYYRHGFIKLYEEKWCFKYMNKQLSVCINNTTVFFSSHRHQIEGISNNIRILTKSNINIRTLNEPKECLKIIMNYPNGLSVQHHENNCEQAWLCEDTPQREKKRIFTNCGAIISFLNSNDLIVIMRYNGEVYRLYQHDVAEEDSDEVIGYNQESRNSVQYGTTRATKSTTSNLKALVSNEIKFLSSLCSTYNLTYLHLVITTSQGKRLNLTPVGEIYEERPCKIQEWHDYCANESYCERSDGVKMIWTQNTFKCFHPDGSVFTTVVEEDVAEANAEELESNVTQSSSHTYLLQELVGSRNILSENENKLNGYLATSIENLDLQIIQYICKSWSMQHASYAEVHVITSMASYLPARMEIFGKDNIRIYIQAVEEVDQCDYLKSESDDVVIKERNIRFLINLWIGEDLHIATHENSCEIFAAQRQSKNENGDWLTLSLKYTDCINDAFHNMVNKIASAESWKGYDLEELYFVKKVNTDSSIRGFEFYSLLPSTSKYTYRFGNNIMELKTVNTVSESMINNYECHKKDLKKFPRFAQKQEKKSYYKRENEFPRLVSANIFFKIPKQLQGLANVTKFLEPFETINFKNFSGKFTNILNYHFKPLDQLHLKKLISNEKWRRRQYEHERRVCHEKLRLRVYSVMNKHGTYPNYWSFTQTYANELKRIDFGDFIKTQWQHKDAEAET